MGDIEVTVGDPRHPEATALLKQSHALMERLFPPEDNFFLDIHALAGPDIVFFIAQDAGRVVGTGALAVKAGYGEVKSMFTDEAARGQGVAGKVLAAIEAEARARGLGWLRLETGNLLEAAHRVYRAAGFTERGPFGAYPDAASSLFMEKRLS
ncbi:GNAT family N-acetyltransferase [Vannielia litorea]|uniref:GNAT family N-acetyltransferase n=1 Tax=Vannielia litorea TaxID=1217970 RepID=UPI001C96530B|nr:GNAT family N-acetyltransferase [Vannielia litorea]MBY6154495.1 GNAT family N-acetyltransferase [Vannielia litorea]